MLAKKIEILDYLCDTWGVPKDPTVLEKVILSIADWICYFIDHNVDKTNPTLPHQYTQYILWGIFLKSYK